MTKLDWEKASKKQPAPKQHRKAFAARWRKFEGQWCVETHSSVNHMPGTRIKLKNKSGQTAEVWIYEAVGVSPDGLFWKPEKVKRS
jgi:hypothetical protein